jgi:GntR family transcriptional repressor for pyruvate dehydrogenase complex
MDEPLKSLRLYEQIVERIRDRILKGELKPGDQLPTERELAERFGVSRVAVREAIKTLVQTGLVEVQPGRGTFVVDKANYAVRQSLHLAVQMQQNDRSLVNLMQIREILEPEIAALAAEHATPEHIADMQAAIAAMDSAADTPDVYTQADLDFHQAVTSASQNDLIPILIDPVVDLLLEHRRRTFTIDGAPQRAQAHHKRILSAIIAHDPEAARTAMRNHLRQVRSDTRTSEALASFATTEREK